MDPWIHVGAIAYGALLMLGLFVRTPLTEALRIDAMFIPQAGDASRDGINTQNDGGCTARPARRVNSVTRAMSSSVGNFTVR